MRMPDEGVTAWDDLIRGRIEYPNEKIEDLVLVRADGRPTYNFASPVEDWLDGITHVLRGDDHISNTPKQIQILEGARSAAARVRAPGEHPRRGREEALQTARGGLGRGAPRRGLHPRGARQLPRPARLELRRQDDDHVARGARRALHPRARGGEPGGLRLQEARMAERHVSPRSPAGRVRRPARHVSAGAGKRLGRGARAPLRSRSSRRRSPRCASTRASPASSSRTSSQTPRFSTATCWPRPSARSKRRSRSRAEAIEQALRAVAEQLELKPREAFQPIRVAVTGSKISPGLFESIELLGRERSLERIRQAREAVGLGAASGSRAR